MFEDIIEAGSRVLCKFPPGRFNTILVAQEAGISVGSLYQYFPDKASLLFAIQQREWASTRSELKAILHGGSRPAIERLEAMMMYFFETEWRERDLRESLKVACSEYKEAPEFKKLRSAAVNDFHEFVTSEFALSESEVNFWAPFLLLTMSSQAEGTTVGIRTKESLRTWARHSVTMLLGYFRANTSIDVN